MVAELPDFVDGLIDIARRGRSLGVHLILATQRPAGVVSADIRANTNLRIALRVTSADESADVIDAPRLRAHREVHPRPAATSDRARPTWSRSSRLASAGAGPAAGRSPPAPRSSRCPGAASAGRCPPRPRRPGPTTRRWRPTCRCWSTRSPPPTSRPACGQQRRPWLEPLPELITLGELPAVAAAGQADIPPIPYGLTDLPHRQARAPLTLDFAAAGHTVVAGAARTGRSSLLRTLAGAVAARGLARRRAHLRDRLRRRRAAAGERAAALRRRGGPGAGRPGGAAAQQAPERDRAAPAAARRAGVRRAGRAAGRDLGRATGCPGCCCCSTGGRGTTPPFGEYDYGPAGRDPAAGAPRGQRGRAARRRHHRPGGAARPDRHRVRPPDDLPADRPQRRLAGRDQASARCPRTSPTGGSCSRQAEPAGGPGRAARPGSDRARAGGRAAADRRAGARAVRAAAAASTARCGSTRSRRGSPWPRPTGSTRTSSRRRGCGRWPARAGTNCRRRASTWPRKGPASWSRARRAAGGRPRCITMARSLIAPADAGPGDRAAPFAAALAGGDAGGARRARGGPRRRLPAGRRSTRWTGTWSSSTTPRCCTTRRTPRSSSGSSSPAGTPITA